MGDNTQRNPFVLDQEVEAHFDACISAARGIDSLREYLKIEYEMGRTLSTETIERARRNCDAARSTLTHLYNYDSRIQLILYVPVRRLELAVARAENLIERMSPRENAPNARRLGNIHNRGSY